MPIRFGPAGNSQSFAAAGFKNTEDAPAWLASMGLDAYEYQCGRGVHIGEKTAAAIGLNAKSHGVALSVHSPYYISLSSADPVRRAKNVSYILKSCRAASDMGACRVVVHCGGLSGLSREEAGENTVSGLREALSEMDNQGFSDIRLCIETMGRINVYGTLEEVCLVCAEDERLIPCIDFGHVNSRTQGGLKEREDFIRLFDTMENLVGAERTRTHHAHFSKIEYSSGGEVRHLTLDDDKFGPDFIYAAEIIAERGYEPVIICESAGTQAEDAVRLREIYAECLKRGGRA